MGIVRCDDHTTAVRDVIESNIRRAYYAIGNSANGMVKAQFRKYDKPPIDTGNLRNSIHYELRDDAVYVGTNVEYALYVHDGTRFMIGRPFLLDAITRNDENMDRLTQIAQREVKRGL